MYEYEALVERIIDGDTLDVRIDLGFDIWHRLRIRVAHNLQLMAVVANESAHEHAWHKGDTVFCSIHTDDIVVVEQK